MAMSSVRVQLTVWTDLDVDSSTVDPDLSNPTRPRLERPLDTIRSFEKAIDNGYKRRSSYLRSGMYQRMLAGYLYLLTWHRILQP